MRQVTRILLLLLTTLTPTVGLALTVGPNSATSCVLSGTGGTALWAEPQKAAGAGDNAFATVLMSPTSNTSTYLICTGFNAQVPYNGTVGDVIFSVSAKASAGLVFDNKVYPVVDGAVVTTTNYASGTVWSSPSETLHIYTMSPSVTYTQANAANFGIAFSVKTLGTTNRIVSVDNVSLTVDYTAGNTATATATRTATGTRTATATVTQTPTSTLAPTRRWTATQYIPTATQTGTATRTSTPTQTRTATATATSTGTVTATGTATSTRTITNTPVNTNTVTRTPTVTATGTVTSTSTSTATATAISTLTPTVAFTAVSTATATGTATATPTGIRALWLGEDKELLVAVAVTGSSTIYRVDPSILKISQYVAVGTCGGTYSLRIQGRNSDTGAWANLYTVDQSTVGANAAALTELTTIPKFIRADVTISSCIVSSTIYGRRH